MVPSCRATGHNGVEGNTAENGKIQRCHKGLGEDGAVGESPRAHERNVISPDGWPDADHAGGQIGATGGTVSCYGGNPIVSGHG